MNETITKEKTFQEWYAERNGKVVEPKGAVSKLKAMVGENEERENVQEDIEYVFWEG